MATPIRWDNVTINSGASAAAFGRNSTDQGRAAIEGLDIFSQRMQDRVDREDTLLTNEAIGTALNGGPAVSNNRRVDAEKLQLAVERDALGNRQERGFEDDLLSSAVNRRLNTANAGIAEYNLETAPERWDYETKMKDAQLELEQARVGQDQERLKIAQRQVAELDRIQKGRQGFNAFMFGPELRDAADKEFDEAMAANPGSVNMTPEHRAGLREEARKSYRERFLQDPQNVYTVGQRFGLDALEVEKYTGAGRDSRESTVLFRQSQADIAAANAEEATKVRSAAEAVTANDTSKILWNGSNWTWGTGPKVNDAITADTLSRLNLKADDENTPGFVSAVKAKFPNATAFTAAMEQLIGKFPKGVIPDQKTYEKEIDLLVEAIKGQAEKDSKISQESYVATSTEDLVSNFIDKITSTVPPTDAEPVETGQALAADLNLSADYIAQIGVTDTDPTVARAKMDMVGDGLLAQGESIELPEDASTQVQGLFNQYQAASKVAAGGSYIPEPAFTGSIGAGGRSPVRAQTPTFEVRREKALEATKLLQSLLAQIKQEGDASIERQFQTELNAPRQ
jgi:hypothetical protein